MPKWVQVGYVCCPPKRTQGPVKPRPETERERQTLKRCLSPGCFPFSHLYRFGTKTCICVRSCRTSDADSRQCAGRSFWGSSGFDRSLFRVTEDSQKSNSTTRAYFGFRILHIYRFTVSARVQLLTVLLKCLTQDGP